MTLTNVLRNTPLRVLFMAIGLAMAALAGAGCAADAVDDEITWDEDEDGDDLDDGSGEETGDIEDAVPLICQPDEIEGSVLRLSLDSTGAMRARGAVWSNVAPCNVSLYVVLRRSGSIIDSQQKSCGDESCRSRLLGADNPPGDQLFCVDVKQTSTGTLLDRKCKVR